MNIDDLFGPPSAAPPPPKPAATAAATNVASFDPFDFADFAAPPSASMTGPQNQQQQLPLVDEDPFGEPAQAPSSPVVAAESEPSREPQHSQGVAGVHEDDPFGDPVPAPNQAAAAVPDGVAVVNVDAPAAQREEQRVEVQNYSEPPAKLDDPVGSCTTAPQQQEPAHQPVHSQEQGQEHEQEHEQQHAETTNVPAAVIVDGDDAFGDAVAPPTPADLLAAATEVEVPVEHHLDPHPAPAPVPAPALEVDDDPFGDFAAAEALPAQQPPQQQQPADTATGARREEIMEVAAEEEEEDPFGDFEQATPATPVASADHVSAAAAADVSSRTNFSAAPAAFAVVASAPNSDPDALGIAVEEMCRFFHVLAPERAAGADKRPRFLLSADDVDSVTNPHSSLRPRASRGASSPIVGGSASVPTVVEPSQFRATVAARMFSVTAATHRGALVGTVADAIEHEKRSAGKVRNVLPVFGHAARGLDMDKFLRMVCY